MENVRKNFSSNIKTFYILGPEGFSKRKLYKLGSRIHLTILPLIQSNIKWISSIPVMLGGSSVLYDPEINWMKPSIIPETPE